MPEPEQTQVTVVHRWHAAPERGDAHGSSSSSSDAESTSAASSLQPAVLAVYEEPGKKRHQTRKSAQRKVVPVSPASSSQYSRSSTEERRRATKTLLSPRSKKEQRRERNRQLAALSRDRRKIEFEELRRENEELRRRLAKFEGDPKVLGAVAAGSFLALCADSSDASTSSHSAAVVLAYLNNVSHVNLGELSQLIGVAVLLVLGLSYLLALNVAGNWKWTRTDADARAFVFTELV